MGWMNRAFKGWTSYSDDALKREVCHAIESAVRDCDVLPRRRWGVCPLSRKGARRVKIRVVVTPEAEATV